jgi:hypothetical protein
MGITGGKFTVGIADTDHRAAIKPVRRHAFVLHPAAVNDAILVFPAEPVVTAEFL